MSVVPRVLLDNLWDVDLLKYCCAEFTPLKTRHPLCMVVSTLLRKMSHLKIFKPLKQILTIYTYPEQFQNVYSKRQSSCRGL